jgi:hypothetical protein
LTRKENGNLIENRVLKKKLEVAEWLFPVFDAM